MHMDSREFRKALKKLDWSIGRAADELNVSYYTARRWHEGSSPISGPASRLVEMLLEEAKT